MTIQASVNSVSANLSDPDKLDFTYTQTKVHRPEPKLWKDNRIISAFNRGQWLESFRMLRTRCLQSMDAMEWKTIAITSICNQAGTSSTAANLAISIAMELNRTALVIDANFRNPTLAKLFGIPGEKGLSDYLLHDTPIRDLLVNPGIERLVVLPAGQPMFNATELLRSPKMLRLVKEMRERYPSRIIVFDMPPILAHDDTLGFAPFVDCVLLVLAEGHSKIDDLKHAASLLRENNVLGTVLNKSTDQIIKFDD